VMSFSSSALLPQYHEGQHNDGPRKVQKPVSPRVHYFPKAQLGGQFISIAVCEGNCGQNIAYTDCDHVLKYVGFPTLQWPQNQPRNEWKEYDGSKGCANKCAHGVNLTTPIPNEIDHAKTVSAGQGVFS